jgi:hypothetical protein
MNTSRFGVMCAGSTNPPGALEVKSTPHSFAQLSTDCGDSSASRYSHISMPMPPAPITATDLPTGLPARSTSG